MKTIKCKIINKIDIFEYLQKYNSVLHISYNQLKNGISQSNIKKDINQKYKGLNSFIIQNAIVQAQGILKSFQSRKIEYEKKNPGKNLKEVYFGGRKNLKDYLKGLISKSEYKINRLKPITIAGETRQKGNRLFNLDFQNNRVEFKPKNKIKINIQFILSNKQKQELLKVQELCQRKEFSIAISFNNKNIYFCYDEIKLNSTKYFYSNLKHNRILGIDQNPNYIGISVLEFNNNDNFKVLHKQVFNLKQLTQKSGKSSNDKKSKYLINKRKFETINLSYEIDKLVNYWKCKKVIVEDLNFKSSNFKCRNLNRLCRNSWDRCLFENKLKMLSKLHGYEVVEINPSYTSIIGNILYGNENTPDMIAASIEIARRGFKKFEKGQFYPKFDRSLNQMNEQWKQTSFDNSIDDWKKLFSLIKNLKLKYRVLLDDILNKNIRSFSLNNKNSMVQYILFNTF